MSIMNSIEEARYDSLWPTERFAESNWTMRNTIVVDATLVTILSGTHVYTLMNKYKGLVEVSKDPGFQMGARVRKF